jgi:hypothetical protein
MHIFREDLSLRKVNFKQILHLLDSYQKWKGFNSHGTPGVPRVKVRTSTCEYIDKKRNVDPLQKFAIFYISRFGYCEANSHAAVDRAEEGDDLGLFPAFCDLECCCPIITRNTQKIILC